MRDNLLNFGKSVLKSVRLPVAILGLCGCEDMDCPQSHEILQPVWYGGGRGVVYLYLHHANFCKIFSFQRRIIHH